MNKKTNTNAKRHEQKQKDIEKRVRREQLRESKRTKSIANRINLSWVWRLVRMFIIIDLAVFGLLGYQMFGNELFTNFSVVLVELEEELRFLYVTVFAIQGLFLVFYMLLGRRSIRRKLRPLYDMAYATERLTEEDENFEAKYHSLEDAIDKISPNRPDAKLVTGDSDLQGLETAVNNLMDRMRESYRQQSRFVSDASHELRTPISVIQGYVNMLDRWGAEDEKVLTESIEAIKSESEHMKRLVEQLLFLARGDSGKTQINLAIFSLNHMVKEVYEESMMIDGEHKYQLIVPEQEVYAVADETMIKQTARILVDNAVKYSPAGETIIIKTGRNGDVPFFTVQDSGVGFSQEDAPHVFERFYRSDSSRARVTGGTGLGLSIAKWIVDRHGGYFDVLSREGLGTRITVNLPRR